MHRKTGAIACWLGSAMNKSNNNEMMVVYCPDDDDNSMFVMNENDFFIRFKPYEQNTT